MVYISMVPWAINARWAKKNSTPGATTALQCVKTMSSGHSQETGSIPQRFHSSWMLHSSRCRTRRRTSWRWRWGWCVVQRLSRDYCRSPSPPYRRWTHSLKPDAQLTNRRNSLNGNFSVSGEIGITYRQDSNRWIIELLAALTAVI